MQLSNTPARYGAVAKAFHWFIALGVISMIPLGIAANEAPFDSAEALQRKFFLFSLHKTLGVAIFFAALARIAWALAQPKPAPLHPERRLETFLAATVHWLLYGSLVLVPLMGWISHAAVSGFAPIWWPFGQSLPFVPKDELVAERFGQLHIVFERVLAVSIILHVAGALKHHFWDRDATLRRMLPGRAAVPDVARAPRRHGWGPAIAAGLVYVAALGIGGAIGAFGALDTQASSNLEAQAPTSTPEQPSDWVVEGGRIAIAVTELGNRTEGAFSDWSAQITYDERAATDGTHGEVLVTVALGSLTLGAVTDMAKGAEFFDVNTFPTATFAGPIRADADGLYVDGALTIREITQPLLLRFTLAQTGDRAEANALTVVDRMAHEVGKTYTDPTQVAFEVAVEIALTAVRAPSQ